MQFNISKNFIPNHRQNPEFVSRTTKSQRKFSSKNVENKEVEVVFLVLQYFALSQVRLAFIGYRVAPHVLALQGQATQQGLDIKKKTYVNNFEKYESTIEKKRIFVAHHGFNLGQKSPACHVPFKVRLRISYKVYKKQWKCFFFKRQVRGVYVALEAIKGLYSK